jgi:hypothetical protein
MRQLYRAAEYSAEELSALYSINPFKVPFRTLLSEIFFISSKRPGQSIGVTIPKKNYRERYDIRFSAALITTRSSQWLRSSVL